ncbi:hypothetical protein PO883_31750 [Massilia sp. DJPM01]|uniref:hypothetical protein n=1 Tax=Massilia sp. DJPM01 TaxID=3024404 RepID=UPI00259F6177|nr:hypothetical protein [Massilia sp. DJPM01]MDM5181757.1 hypothetical protein [Massilia sp. DJPM01]
MSASYAQNAHRRPTIGGFYLGMTNAQAAKIGLRDCRRKFSYSDIECVPELPPLPGVTEARIRFDAKTRTAVELQVEVVNKVGTGHSAGRKESDKDAPWSPDRWWREADTLATVVQDRLGFACASRYTEVERRERLVTNSCFIGDVTQRVRHGYNEVYESSSGRHRGNDPHFQVLVTLKKDGGEKLYRIQQEMAAQSRKAESELRDFAAGKNP